MYMSRACYLLKYIDLKKSTLTSQTERNKENHATISPISLSPWPLKHHFAHKKYPLFTAHGQVAGLSFRSSLFQKGLDMEQEKFGDMELICRTDLALQDI